MKNTRLFGVALLVALLFQSTTIFAQLAGQIPLNPKDVPQFVDPLPHFAGLRVDATDGGLLNIRAVPHQQVAVSTGTPLATGVAGTNPSIGLGNYWVYQIFDDDGNPLSVPLWPAFTIEAKRGTPLSVLYENKLVGQTYADVNLVLDQTLHWALGDMSDPNPPMTPYGGDVPIVAHLHGGEVPSESDGGPDAWFTPDYAQTGPAWGLDGTDEYYYYPNSQEAATLWFHDHALGATRLNVYAGLAGFYFLRDEDEDDLMLPGWSGDDLVQEQAPPGASGTFQSQPYLPEIEVVIQDRMFDTNGELYFPNLAPNPTVHPYWSPEFVGDIITVNGRTWPYLSVAPRKYRFRFLNGSNARFYELWLQDQATGQPGPAIMQIGTDGGFLDAPVVIDPANGGKLVMGPGERFDIIIDFTGTAGQTFTVRNTGRTPYPKGESPQGSTVGRIMQFVVNGTMVSADDPVLAGMDKSTVPAALRSGGGLVKLSNFDGTANPAANVVQERQLTLVELMAPGGPLEMLVNNTKWDGNGHMTPGLGTTETPAEGTTEVWKIINLTADAHPMHLHLVQYQLVSRQKFKVNQYLNAYNAAFPSGQFEGGAGSPLGYMTTLANGYLGGNPDVTPYLLGPAKPPAPNEQGWKDTFIMYPGEVTTMIVRFAPTDLPLDTPEEELLFDFDPSEGPGYVWHCHIIDHEDNEMMRPMEVTTAPGAHPDVITPGGEKPAAEKGVDLPNGFELAQNSPNPCSGITEIGFRLAYDHHVTLTLYNNLGEVVAVLIDEMAPAGNNTVKLDVSGLHKGIYFYRLSLGVGSRSDVKKLVVMN